MCWCDPNIRTPCCGRDSCHDAVNQTRETCPWCAHKARPEARAEEFMECDACAAKSGSPVLCIACQHNRALIAHVTALLKQYMGKEPPLLQCVDCKNTESCAGAMARIFNQGRCVHCGGYFKVIRA